jgi:hypothetical protein
MSDEFLTAKFPELKEFSEYNIKSYEDLYKFSIEHNELFWSTLAKSRLDWYELFTQVRSGDFTDENFSLKWFLGGKLNVSGKIILYF